MSLYVVIMSIAISFLITVLISPIFIPFLRKLKFGQSVREEGPQSHLAKSGTPTMGGIMIIFSVAITSIVMALQFMEVNVTYEYCLLLFVLLGYGLLGFLVDFIIVAMKRNLGLTSKQKLFGQILIAVVFYITLLMNDFPTYISVPCTSIQWELGWLYPILIVFMLVGSSNAVNLTDGLEDPTNINTIKIGYNQF